MHSAPKLRLLLATMVSTLLAAGASAQVKLDTPPAGTYVIDEAHMLDAAQASRIQALSAELVSEREIPIVVCTITSMSAHWPRSVRIETLARALFDQWQIGKANWQGQPWNRGILLLVSRDDRKARIELGGGWGRQTDSRTAQIMDGQITPAFKQKNFGGGILAGVEGLARLARGVPLPGEPVQAQPLSAERPEAGAAAAHQATRPGRAKRGLGGIGFLVVIGVGVFFLSKVLRSAGGGVSPYYGGTRIGAPRGRGSSANVLGGFLLGQLLSGGGSRRRSGGSGSSGGFGGFGGGSSFGGFGGRGGGSSGGGGATGSW